MKSIQKESFKIIGLTIRTTNEKATSANDIATLWEQFMGAGIAKKIPNRIDDLLLGVYTNYEKDHTGAYDVIVGCKVSTLQEIPEGLVGKALEEGKYMPFKAKGNLMEGVVYKRWTEIWEEDLARTYLFDFEVYDENLKDPTNTEVAIFVGVK